MRRKIFLGRKETKRNGRHAFSDQVMLSGVSHPDHDVQIAGGYVLLVDGREQLDLELTVQLAQLSDARQQPMFSQALSRGDPDQGRALTESGPQILLKPIECRDHRVRRAL